MPMLTPEQVKKLEAQNAAASPSSPGVLRSFERGVRTAPMFQPQYAAGSMLTEKPGFTRPNWAGSEGMTDQRYQSLLAQRNGPDYSDPNVLANGIAPPTNFAERVAGRLGNDSPFLVANVAGGGAASGLNTAKNLVIQFVTSDTAAQYAQDKGYGALGQFLAGIAGGVAGGVAANRADSAARAIAGRLTGEAPPVTVPQLPDQEIYDIAKKYRISKRSVREAAQTALDMFIDDPTGKNPSIEEFKRAVEASAKTFKDSGTTPTSAQLAGRLGAEDIVGRESKSALADPAFRRALGGQKMAAERFLNEQWDSLVPNGSADGLIQKASTLADDLEQSKAAAWSKVNFDEIPKTSVDPLKSTLASIDQRPAYAKFIPSEIRDMIEQAPDGEISALHLQDIKARLGGIIADGKQWNASESQRAARVAAGKLQDAVTAQLKSLPEGDANSAYRAAVKATSDYYDVFNPDSVAVKSLRDLTSGDKIASRIMGSNDPLAELEASRKVLEKTPGGMDDLKAVFAEQLTEGDIEKMSIKKALKKFTSTDGEKFYRALYGDAYEPMRDTLKGFEWARRYQGGTPANILSTKSAFPHYVEKGVGWISSPIQSLKRAPVWFAELVAGDIKTAAQQEMLIKEALRRPPLLVQLAEIPGKNASAAEVSRFIVAWKSLVAAAKTRDLLQQLTTLGANRAAIAAGNAMAQPQTPGPAPAPQTSPTPFPAMRR